MIRALWFYLLIAVMVAVVTWVATATITAIRR